MIKTTATVTALFLASALPAAAQDVIVYGGAELEHLFSPDGTGSSDTTTFSTYVEAEANGLYLGFSGEIANDDIANEITAYLGYRRDLDSGLSYDLSYTQYYYPNDGGACCGEILLSLGQTLGDKASVSLDIYHVPDDSTSSAYVGFAYDVTDSWNGSINYGVYEVAGAGSESEWDIGATYAITDEVGLDARYYDGSDYTDGYFGLSLTYDTTLFGG
jgi:outer membrane usher protein FimD/PapC